MVSIINLSLITPANEIDPAIASDAELAAAQKAHIDAADPHLQYANQARGDARYGPIKKIVLYGTTAASQDSSVAIPHGVNVSKIVAINALVEHAPGTLVGPGHKKSVGYEFDISVNATAVYIGNLPNNSFNILSRQVRIVIDYLN